MKYKIALKISLGANSLVDKESEVHMVECIENCSFFFSTSAIVCKLFTVKYVYKKRVNIHIL